MESEGRHERGTDEREVARLRHGFASPLERAILEDDDDPLAAASATMGDPNVAPAVVRAAEQDASLGSLRIPGAPGEAVERPTVIFPTGALREGAAERLRGEGWTVHEGDPGDEHEHVDRQVHHVETAKWVVVRDAEGAIVEVLDPDAEVSLADLGDGHSVAKETWPASVDPAEHRHAGPLPSDDGRPTVWAPYGTLSDEALQKLEELGIDVEEVRDPDEPETDALEYGAVHRAVGDDGTERTMRVLPGGAIDLAPRRKVQVWVDLRFQYESDHPHGADDMLEEQRIRRFGKLVEQFATLAVENGEAEGMAIPTVVGHILDKPGDTFPTAG